MNEAETRADLIDPMLRELGWGVVEGSRVLREHHITEGRILTGGQRAKAEIADYVLVYNNQKIGIIEAKKLDAYYTEGLAQAKSYGQRTQIDNVYSTNGKQIYHANLKTGSEGDVESFPTPQELWSLVSSNNNEWHNRFAEVPLSSKITMRYYQEIAIKRALDAIADNKNRILLTLATGTGKTAVAFQIAWKLFESRWNINRDAGRRPRILFLADRNILADQAFNAFGAFDVNALVRINPLDIRKKGSVPMNGSIFFTIFQTFMSGHNDTPYFGDYPSDFFDLIIIDECHRGGANDEGNWRSIMEHFSSAVQIGLTATPKRDDNVDTYRYFGEPLYEYSLKQGINDGFLTPFKVRRIASNIDEYQYSSDDDIIEGEIEEGKNYTEEDFNKNIIINEREINRVKQFMSEINQNEKTIVFCANQEHALVIRDIINQDSESQNPNYCVRVTADDSSRGEQYLREFQDNEKTIPTILTTSQKLSTGVDARNVRNIVLLRPINSMIEFKQIIGRGTRLFDGKEYFTIYDFVNASEKFKDDDWDGPPIESAPKAEPKTTNTPQPTDDGIDTIIDPAMPVIKPKIKIKLADGKEREIINTSITYFYDMSGQPVTAQQFIENLYGVTPELFKNEDDLRRLWSNPETRRALLDKFEEAGFGIAELEATQGIIDAQDSDIFDVLAYVSFLTPLTTRKDRIENAKHSLYRGLDEQEIEFVDFILSKFETRGSDELDLEKLPTLLNIKYRTISDAIDALGGNAERIKDKFFETQEILFAKA
ncbi:MAG: DEAD/DEAH box helicase family protein [Chryseobacterium sp.]